MPTYTHTLTHHCQHIQRQNSHTHTHIHRRATPPCTHSGSAEGYCTSGFWRHLGSTSGAASLHQADTEAEGPRPTFSLQPEEGTSFY